MSSNVEANSFHAFSFFAILMPLRETFFSGHTDSTPQKHIRISRKGAEAQRRILTEGVASTPLDELILIPRDQDVSVSTSQLRPAIVPAPQRAPFQIAPGPIVSVYKASYSGSTN
jgi:hypothetical protein